MRCRTVAVIGAIGVLVAGLLWAHRDAPERSTGAEPLAPPVPAEAGAEPVGPVEVVAGVPRGWRHDAEGARAAAVATVRLTGHIATAGFITRGDIIESISTARFGPTLSARSASQLGEMTAPLGSVGVPASQVLWSEHPLTARVVSADDRRAVVEVWSVLVVGVPGAGAPRQAWRTVTVTMAWERGDWRIDGWASSAGPTPMLAEAAAVDGVEDIAVVAGWRAAGGG